MFAACPPSLYPSPPSSTPLSHRYLSPNGYLQLSPQPQCSGYFATDTCSLSTQYGYRGVLGPLVTDFTPNEKKLNTTGVYYRTNNQSFLCVTWMDVSVWGRASSTLYTTRLCVYKSGAFAWSFEGNVSSPPLPSVSGPIWMVRGVPPAIAHDRFPSPGSFLCPCCVLLCSSLPDLGVLGTWACDWLAVWVPVTVLHVHDK